MIKGFKGGFVGLGKFSEMIFPSRSSTELPLKPFFIFLNRTPNDIKNLNGLRGRKHRRIPHPIASLLALNGD